MKTRNFFIACLSLCLALPQCKDKENGNKEGNSKIKTITLVDAATTLTVGVGEEKEVSVTVTPTNATEAIEWVSIDESKATVTSKPGDDRKATVKGINGGSTEIYAVTASGIESAYRVVSVGESVSIVSITIPGTLDLVIDGEQKVNVSSVSPSTAVEEIKWKSENPTVATATAVSGTNGREAMIRALTNGTATIYATNADGTILSNALTVTVSVAPNYVDYPMSLNPAGWAEQVSITSLGDGAMSLLSQGDNPFIESHGIGTTVITGAIKKQIVFEYRNNKACHSLRFYWHIGDAGYGSAGQQIRNHVPYSASWTEIAIDITSPPTFTDNFGMTTTDSFRFDFIDGNGEADNMALDSCGSMDCWGDYEQAGKDYCLGYQIDIRNIRLRVVF